MSSFKVGLAQVDYTPSVGLPLMGNYRDDYSSRGVHDPLFAKAMVIANSAQEKIALLSVDICMMDRSNVEMMRCYISSETSISKENILIASTHTHSGPASMSKGILPKAKEEQIEKFLKKAAYAVVIADKNLKDSKLKIGYSSEKRVSFNRAMRCADGKTHMNWEGLVPDFVEEVLGAVDPELITLSVEQDGDVKAGIVNFALHPAILAGDNWLYSADYPGYLSEALCKIKNPDFMTLFFNGCCGNVNHIDYSDPLQGRGYCMTQRVGYMLAADAYEAMKDETPVATDKIAVSSEKVALDRYKIDEEKLSWSHQVLEKVKSQGPTSGQVDGLPDEHYAQLWLNMYEKQNDPDEVEVMTIRIGDVGIVGLPGEIFCELGMQIKQNSPAKHTLVFELANDAIGYVITRPAYQQGRYESTCGTTMYAEGSGEKIAENAIEQLNKLFES